MNEPVLAVDRLRVEFDTRDGTVVAVDDLTFALARGEVLSVVGESGSGKTMTAMAILGLLPDGARVHGEIWLGDETLSGRTDAELRHVRGRRVAMVFQDALASLNPVLSIGSQLAEAITAHERNVSRADLRDRVAALLDVVGIPTDRAGRYPHELSGGMRQRVMIAMAIANDPEILIADEPTTALDVTVQAHVLDVLGRVRERTNASMILITHDLGVVAGVADSVLVMYAGRAVEIGTVEQVFYETRHPYTLGLLASLPRLDGQVRDQRLFRIPGTPASPSRVPDGCAFHPRCFRAVLPDPCASIRPDLETGSAEGHGAACHFAAEVRGVRPEELRARD